MRLMMVNLSKKKAQEIFSAHSLGAVKTMRVLEEGLSNPAYVINDSVVLRVRKDANKGKFEKERFLFNLLRKKTDLPVPKVIDLDSSKKIIPHDYILLEKLPGESLKKCSSRLSDRQKKRLAYELGLSLAKIHSIRFKTVGRFKPDKLVKEKEWKGFVWGVYTDSLKKIEKGNFLDAGLIKRIRSFVKGRKELLDVRFRPSLIHSDYNAGNILLHKGKISGIFDMEWSYSGHTEYELSAINIKLMKRISPYQKDFFKGYESKIKRRKDHEKFESFYGIIYWMSIICWVHRTKAKISPQKYVDEIKRLLSGKA
jgi:aminoglycoside phosphotransferase (APT) family kinase protein